MKSHSLVQHFVIVFAISLLSFHANGQEHKVAPTSPELFNEIQMQDSLLFQAFNSQNLDSLKTFFSTDLEWFQDNGGLIHYDTVFMNFKNNFDKGLKLKRTLVKGSLEVHPIKNYGAIEIGVHQFRHMENGKEQLGTFKFVMIWRKQNDKWQITRVISYDH
jgi:hypothetical protein